MRRFLFHPEVTVREYQALLVIGNDYKVINDDGVIVTNGKVLEVTEELLDLTDTELQCKILLLREQLIRSGLTPTE